MTWHDDTLFLQSACRVVQVDDETCIYPYPYTDPYNQPCFDDGGEIKTDLFYTSDDCSTNKDLVAGAVHGEDALFFLSEEKCHDYTEENEKADVFDRCYTNLENETKESDTEYFDVLDTSDHFHSPQPSIVDVKDFAVNNDLETEDDVVEVDDDACVDGAIHTN